MRILLSAFCAIGLFVLAQGQTFTNQTSLLNNTWGSTPCVADMNGDGLDDVVTLETAAGNDISIDYQQADGTFTQVVYDVNAQFTPSWSIAAGDLNADGYLDLMFGGGSRVAFYLSNSTGTAYTEQYINDYIFSQRTNIVDIDGDGDLDAFACHDIDLSHPYRNDGTGFMTEDQSLIATVPLAGNYASVWTDFDNDGDQDLYIAKCRGGSAPQAIERQNALYVNDGTNNYSGNVIADYGLFDDEQSWVTIFEDFDNDGDLDTYTVNHTAQSFLRANDGTGNYTDVSAGSGLDVSDLGSWALIGADFDNDGLVDMLTESTVGKQFYHNEGGMTFIGSSLPFDKGALGDLNNDGYIDVFTGGTLWMNDGGTNNFLKVALDGTNSNINGIGARVECYSDLGMQIRECRAGENFKPMSSLDLFFGLGTDAEVDSVIVRWPSGQVDKITSPAINDLLEVTETLLPSLVRLTYVNPTTQQITIKNFGGESEDISNYRLCSELSCTSDLTSLTLISGDFILAAGEEVTIAWPGAAGLSAAGSDLALFLPTGDMNTAAVMIDFTQWGSGGNGSESVAVAKGIWTAGDFVTLGLDYSYIGTGGQNGRAYWEESPFCPDPTDATAVNLSTTGADLTWTENGTALTWDLEIGLAGFTPNGTPTNTGVSNPFPYAGTQGTSYDYFVRADCAADGGVGTSNWVGPIRFTLPLPVSTCADAIDVSAGGTFNTGFIDGVYDGFETCMASAPNNGNWFIFIAPSDGVLNISSVGIDGVDTQVAVGIGGCGSLTQIACNDDFTGSPPWESEVEFDVLEGTEYYIMWGDGWTANASDYTVVFTPDPVCNDPSDFLASNITTAGADIAWVENGTAVNWDLEIGAAGFLPTGTPSYSTTETAYALTGEEGESFDLYVRANCDPDGGVLFSEWVGPLNVTLVNAYPGYDWLDFSDATPSRLVLTSVANSDDEEKDIAVADLDNDGFDDVIVCRKEPFSVSNEGAKSDLLLMNEDGVLTDRTSLYAPEFISTETFARDLYIDDFDGDGWKDVIIANTFNQQPQYYANLGNDGNGNWLGLADESATRFPTLTDDTPLICAVWGGDLDGDNDQDLYFVNYKQTGGQGVAKDFLLINDGTGVFTDESEARLGDLRNSAFGTSVQIVDMDGDGDEDILKVSTLFSVLPWGDNGLFVLFNEGDGNFTNWQNIAPAAPYMFEVADFNGDGIFDVFVVDDAADYLITVNSAVPDVSLDYTTTYVVNGLNGFGGNVHAIDLDLDGDLDIAVSDVDVDIPPCDSGRRLALLENQGGVFVDHHTLDELEWEGNSYDLGFSDINGDGLQDFITGGCSGYNVFMSDNCDLVTSSADFDLDGLPDACDECPTNPDPNCEPEVDFPIVGTDGSVARQWNELLLESIRKDFARPTVHARNLFHTSVGMWDTWAVYSDSACTFLLGQEVDGFQCDYDPIPMPTDIPAARDEALSYMAYRLLSHRFAGSPSASLLQMAYDAHMDSLGYDITVVSQDYAGGSPAAMGNYVAQCIINFGLQDGANEQNAYANQRYSSVNPPMIVDVPGNESIVDWNRWQPLSLDLFIDQSGNEIPGSTPDFLSPEWGQVSPFALDEADKVTYNRDGFDYEVYHDPGTPPLMDTTGVLDSEDYRWGFITTMLWSSHLDATDGVMMDISPGAIGNTNTLPATVADYPSFYDQLNGGTASAGHAVNPITGQPYAQNLVPRADYARVLAEFWADGPDSETPPGHWFTLLNYVSEHEDLEKRFMGEGPVLDDLEWDVKSYFMMGGAMHDAAVSTWGVKGWYDYLRPISAIRAMAGRGQSTDPAGASYHPAGVPLIPGKIEVIETGDPLAGDNDEYVGDIKIMAWKGHNSINNVDVDEAGVDWIHASEWEPYQRPSFVTPPFAGYISGHSTFSRAAAEVLTSFTGDAYFPGGMGTFTAPQDEFLVFEDGPSQTIELQWATYQDAADESGLSRIWGGIHPPCDDVPGRKNGIMIGQDAFAKGLTYFGGTCSEEECDPCPPANDDCLYALDLIPALFGTPSWDTVSVLGALPSFPACVGDADDDTWYSFTAEGANDIIHAQSVNGNADVVVEVFDQCEGSSLGCFNNYGSGMIERVLLGNLVPGQQYYFRVYDVASGVSAASDIRVQVKTFADGMVSDAHCGVMDHNLTDYFTVERQEGLSELYSNPAIQSYGYEVRFYDPATTNEYTLEQLTGVMYNFQFSGFGGLQTDVPYDVSVRHRLRMKANGQTSYYWSDWGTSCQMGLSSSSTGLANDDCGGAIDITPVLFGTPGWQTFSMVDATESAPGCSGNADDDAWFSFVAQSPNDVVMAQSINGTFDAVIEIFDACGGTSLGCFNNYGNGGVERAVAGNLIAGQSYLFRVYSASTDRADVRLQVKTFADGMVADAYCGVTDYTTADNFFVERQEGVMELYASSAIDAYGYEVRFYDPSTTNEFTHEQLSGLMFDFQFASIAGIQTEIAYDVSVRHRLRMNANGAIDYYWSDWGTSCVMGLSGAPVELANDDCSGAINVDPVLFGTPGWQTYSMSGATESATACIGDADDDVWFSFVAGSANDVVMAQSVNGSFDAVIELFDACGGTSLGCFDNYGGGAVERALVGNLIPGQTYLFRVYSESSQRADVRTQVKTFADGMVATAYCGVTGYALADHFFVERQEAQELYASSNIESRGYEVRFFDPLTLSEFTHMQTTGDMYDFEFSDIVGLVSGVSYDVSVRHRLRMNVNGMVDYHWSDFGTDCILGLSEGQSIIINNDNQAGGGLTTSKLLEQASFNAKIYPNPNAGEELTIVLDGLNGKTAMTQVRFIDVLGKVVYEESIPVKGEDAQFVLYPRGLSAGVYSIYIQVGSQFVTEALIVK